MKRTNSLARNGCEHLLKYRSNGQPLWNGDAKLSVRASDAQEKAAIEEGLKETAVDDGIALVYLVKLDNA
jgi:hypothetical protein